MTRSSARSRLARWIELLALPALVAASATASAQCVVQVPRLSASPADGGTLCASIVPIGVANGLDLAPGCRQRYVMTPGDGTAGNWGFLDFGSCTAGICGLSGATRLECQLANGTVCPSGFQAMTLPGAHRGALRDAIGARFDSDTDRRPGLCFADYLGNGRRVVVLPLTTGTGPGRSIVNIVGFAAFFIPELPGNLGDAIEVEYLHRVAIPR